MAEVRDKEVTVFTACRPARRLRRGVGHDPWFLFGMDLQESKEREY